MNSVQYGKETNGTIDYVKGVSIAGFSKVADPMIDPGAGMIEKTKVLKTVPECQNVLLFTPYLTKTGGFTQFYKNVQSSQTVLFPVCIFISANSTFPALFPFPDPFPKCELLSTF
ncbi:hypothetical protein [Fluviicola sp.]|jgi:hypothetical protein|uniref:hypothetical protein n=1 Tax=Fluviicola sp. TaxID=1917219 RepID=UPI00281BBCF0|nr:hypothetical protein [Fluviicola sp.]MDR0803319.1 hypothetical protein [Fluviicola sp.]